MQLIQRQIGNRLTNRLNVPIVLELLQEFRQYFTAGLKRLWAE
jgi:hypothetical protein